MKLKVAFLNVGQGDSTVITLPDSRTAIIVDCHTATAKRYLDDQHISEVLYVFLTHSDFDHTSHVVSLLSNFLGATLFYNPDSLLLIQEDNKRRELLRRLAKLKDKGLTFENPRLGDSWKVQEEEIEVLHPSTGDRIEALDVTLQGIQIMFPLY